MFGSTAGFGASINLSAIAAGTGGFVINGESTLDKSGFSVSSAGDFNGDGFSDLLVGAPSSDGDTDGRSNGGDTYLIYGTAAGFSAINLADIAGWHRRRLCHPRRSGGGSGPATRYSSRPATSMATATTTC